MRRSQLWGSLRAVTWVFGRVPLNIVECVPVGTLKQFATGNGAANKRQMAAALAIADPTHYVLDFATGRVWRDHWALDDSEVHAIWVGRFTAAVDRGQQDFLSAFEKKEAHKLEQRTQKSAAKTARKVLKETQEINRRALVANIKKMGKCCNVFRKPAPHRSAICPKCYTAVRIPKLALVA